MPWTPTNIPYYRPVNELPAALPDEETIFSSNQVLRSDTSHHRVVAVEPHFIVKYGRGVREIEGQVLLFLEYHLGSRSGSPRLYAMFRMEQTNYVCIIMQHMPGELLSKLWPKLQDDEKTSICNKLNKTLSLIRQISPPSFFGNVTGGAISHHLFYSRDGDKEICGPFDSESGFNAALIKRLDVIYSDTRRCNARVDFYKKNLDRILNGHPIVFSHCDIQKKNILVSGEVSNGFNISIVDWESAGWFPSYWDYFIAFISLSWDDDWAGWIDSIFEPFFNEAAVMKMVYNDLVF